MKSFFILLILVINTAIGATSTVRLGMASNFSELSTVSFNPYGGYFRDGIHMALEQSKEKLAAKGINIVMTEFDYGADDLNVIKAVKDADKSGVSAVIGYSYSSNALIAAPLHIKAKMPMLSPSASANRLSSFGKYIHLGSFSNQFMAQTLAKFSVHELKARKVIMIPAANCAYCTDLADTFESELLKQGGQIVKKIPVLQDEKSFRSVAELIKNLDFDAVFIPNQELTSARIISSLLDFGINKPFLGADGWGNEGKEFFNVLKNRKFTGYSVTHWHPKLQTRKSLEFVRIYKEKYKKVPNDTSVLAFDYMNFLIETILTSKLHDRENLEDALQGMKGFEGVTGKYKLAANKAPQKNILILKSSERGFEIDESWSPPRGSK